MLTNLMNGQRFKDLDDMEWIRVGDGCTPYVLAVRADGSLPAPVMLVCDAEAKRKWDEYEARQQEKRDASENNEG